MPENTRGLEDMGESLVPGLPALRWPAGVQGGAPGLTQLMTGTMSGASSSSASAAWSVASSWEARSASIVAS